jgi:ribosomal protein S18 acetylase RimI-like enzyme
MDNYSVRKAKQEDAKAIWDIRNHPASRKYSANSEEIPLEKHLSWFVKKYFSEEDNHCFVLVNSVGTAVGYCRFDLDSENDHYIVSLALDTDYHGKGLGGFLLNNVLQRFRGKKDICAEIQKDNIASVKLFQKNNFIEYNENEKNYYLKFTKHAT